MSFLTSLESIAVVITCFVLIFFAIFFLYIFIVEYFFKRKDAQAEESEYPLEDASEESMCVTDVCDIVFFIHVASERIKRLNNPDLKYALEELNSAAGHCLTAAQTIVDLNYPVDEDDL